MGRRCLRTQRRLIRFPVPQCRPGTREAGPRGPGPVQKTAGQTPDVAAVGQHQCLMLLPLPRGEWTRVRAGDDHGHRAPGLGTAAGRSAPLPRRALDGPKLRPGLLLLGGGMEEVPCHDPSVGRTSETPDRITLVLVGIWRETPLFATGGNGDSPALPAGLYAF